MQRHTVLLAHLAQCAEGWAELGVARRGEVHLLPCLGPRHEVISNNLRVSLPLDTAVGPLHLGRVGVRAIGCGLGSGLELGLGVGLGSGLG